MEENIKVPSFGHFDNIEIERTGVYAIVKNNKDQYLIQKFKNGDYWWPGGGIDKNENKKEALIKEIKEETGYIDFEIKENFAQSKYCVFLEKAQKTERTHAFYYEVNLFNKYPVSLLRG